VLVEVHEGRYVASPAMTLNDLLNRWLDVKRQAVEPSMLTNYEWISPKYIRPALGDRKVGALRRCGRSARSTGSGESRLHLPFA
jgi:hypothetical protein